MGDSYYYIYIMTNLHNTTLYTGITNDLARRVQEHKRGEGGKFSQRYQLKKLVYFEVYEDVKAAINRETNQGWLTDEETGANRKFESRLE